MTCEHTHKDAPENAVCEDCYEEMKSKELKTLKDFLNGKERRTLIDSELLKSEAVKWVKRYDYRNEEIKQQGNLATSWEYHYNHITIEFIKHFFNLTEEDLK